MRKAKPHFATLDCHVATLLLLAMTNGKLTSNLPFSHEVRFTKQIILRNCGGIFIPAWTDLSRHTQCAHQASTRSELRLEFLSLLFWERRVVARLEIARTNAVFVNRKKYFRFYLGDSHGRCVPSEWRIVAIDFTAMSFEQWCAAREIKKAIYKKKARICVLSVNISLF